MNLSYFVAAIIGVMVTIGVLQLLNRDIIRMIIGMYILWNALNLLIISIPAFYGLQAPLIGEGNGAGGFTDPLIQALVLTAIVITFGFSALLVALVSWLSIRKKSINITDFQQDHD